jgi:hypothetical protein
LYIGPSAAARLSASATTASTASPSICARRHRVCVAGRRGIHAHGSVCSTASGVCALRHPPPATTHLLDVQLTQGVLPDGALQFAGKLRVAGAPSATMSAGAPPRVGGRRASEQRHAATHRLHATPACRQSGSACARTSGNAAASCCSTQAGVAAYLPSAYTDASSSPDSCVSSHSCCCSASSCLQNCSCWLYRSASSIPPDARRLLGAMARGMAVAAACAPASVGRFKTGGRGPRRRALVAVQAASAAPPEGVCRMRLPTWFA